MTAVLRLATGGGAPLGVELGPVRAVLEPHGIVALPDPRPGVLGLLRPDREALPVLAPFGTQGAHVVVLDCGTRRFGLLVERVLGLTRVPDSAIGPPPEGQADALLRATADLPDGRILILDVERLAARL